MCSLWRLLNIGLGDPEADPTAGQVPSVYGCCHPAACLAALTPGSYDAWSAYR